MQCFEIRGETLDDVMRSAVQDLLAYGEPINPSKGPAVELRGVTMKLGNIRARLSRTETRGKLFSSLGELCWYLAGSDDKWFAGYYLSHYLKSGNDDGIVPGAYGPRLFGSENQIQRVIDLLHKRPDSRRAVVQLLDAKDLDDLTGDTPCTCTLQFMVRSGTLEMVTFMRSNDVMKGMAHDVFAFTMLQELVARSLDVDVGGYTHFVGSLHLYAIDTERAEAFIGEGWQSTDLAMPAMPLGDPWDAIGGLLDAEKSIRLGEDAVGIDAGLEPYWSDLIGVLTAWRAVTDRDVDRLEAARQTIASDVFDIFIEERVERLRREEGPASDSSPSSRGT